MRRLPKSVRVIGHRVPVRPISNLMHNDEGTEDENGHRAYGVFDPSQPDIWLDKASGPERTKSTLVHESLHCMLSLAHIEVEHEEELVSRLSPILLDFLRANRGAIAYLQES